MGVPSIKSLYGWNWGAFALHLTFFIVFAVWLNIVLSSNFTSATLERIAVEEPVDPNQLQTSINFPIKLQSIGSVNVPWLILSFFAITFVFHLLYATDFFGTGLYSKAIGQGWNPYRWLEYGISASIMIFILAILSGCRDINSFIPIIVACAITQGFGFLNEKSMVNYSNFYRATLETAATAGKEGVADMAMQGLKAARETILTGTGLAWPLLAFGAWFPILFTIVFVIQDANGYDKAVPTWVPVIVALQLFYYTTFGFVQAWQVNAVRKLTALPNYASVEKWYILLSFISKATLGSVLAYGLISRQNDAS